MLFASVNASSITPYQLNMLLGFPVNLNSTYINPFFSYNNATNTTTIKTPIAKEPTSKQDISDTPTSTPSEATLVNSPTPTSGPTLAQIPPQSSISDYQKYLNWSENGGDPTNDGIIMSPLGYYDWCQADPNASKPWLQES